MQDSESSSPDVDQIQPALKKGRPKSFNCPSCGGTISLKAVGYSITAICQHCSSVIDVANENFQVITEAKNRIKATVLPIGSRGKLQGIEWEIIGMMIKEDGSNNDYSWEEYLLFNPYYGFRFLVQYDGHWNLLKVIRKDIVSHDTESYLTLGDQNFKLFFAGSSVVNYVMGEFYWRVRKGERVSVLDYISPPEMISIEKSKDEIVVALGEYIDANVIFKAFNSENWKPRRKGIYANQPNPYSKNFNRVWLIGLFFVMIGLVHNFVINVTNNTQIPLSVDFTVFRFNKNRTFMTSPFVLPEAGNMALVTYIPVDNNWAELGYTLINEKNEELYNFTQAIEYYHGYDSVYNEHWREGSQHKTAYFSYVPAGTYRFIIDVDASALVDINLKVISNVDDWVNFLVFLPLIFIYPFWVMCRYSRFEARRMESSDINGKY